MDPNIIPIKVKSISRAEENKEGNMTLLFISATVFVVLDLVILLAIIVSFFDSHFDFCTYSVWDFGHILANCPSILGWYGAFVGFISTVFVYIILFLFLPLVIFLSFYLYVLGGLLKLLNTPDATKNVKLLIASTVLFPILFFFSYSYVLNNVRSKTEHKKVITESSHIIK
jgi:hypothetical protein